MSNAVIFWLEMDDQWCVPREIILVPCSLSIYSDNFRYNFIQMTYVALAFLWSDSGPKLQNSIH